ESWDTVVQTSSNLFSALSFGTIPARRSPLSVSEEEEEGKWIVGGGGRKIWVERDVISVPISLGNQRPGYFNDQIIEDDGLQQIQICVYKVPSITSKLIILAFRYITYLPPQTRYKTSLTRPIPQPT